MAETGPRAVKGQDHEHLILSDSQTLHEGSPTRKREANTPADQSSLCSVYPIPREKPRPPPSPAGRVRSLTWLNLVASLKGARSLQPRRCHSCWKEATAMPSAPAGLGAVGGARLHCDASPWRHGSLPAAQLGTDRCRREAGLFIRRAGAPGGESKEMCFQ